VSKAPSSASLPVKKAEEKKSKPRLKLPDEDEEDDDPTPPTPQKPEIDDEDEPEEDGKLHWIEYKQPKNNVSLWYNPETGLANIGSVPSDEEMKMLQNPELLRTRFNKARRNSTLISSAWDVHSKPKRAAGNAARTQDAQQSAADRVGAGLKDMERALNNVLENRENLSGPVIDDLRAIGDLVKKVMGAIEGGDAVIDDRNAVEALIEWGKRAWDFKNSTADHYRAAAAKVPHQDYEFKAWHIPEYLSEFPLPPDSSTITCVVSLPVEHKENEAMTHTRIQVGAEDKVSHAIHQAYIKCQGRGLGPESEFVLKAVGLNDFMTGDRVLFEYEYVRHCVRDGVELKLALVQRPKTLEPPKSDIDLPAEYMKKVVGGVEVITEDTHRGLSVRDNWSDLKAVPMSEMVMPFRVRVCGLDSLSPEGCPRMNPDDLSNVQVEMFLFHGMDILENSTWITDPREPSSSPRWQTWLQGPTGKEIMINELPRMCRIAFVVKSTTKADKNPETLLLAWCVCQLVDEHGRMLSGPQDLHMWPYPAAKQGKHGKKRDFTIDANFLFRMPTRDNLSQRDACVLRVQFDSFAVPVVAPLTEKYREPDPRIVGVEVSLKTLSRTQNKQLTQLINADPLYVMSPEDKQLLWMMRHSLVEHSQVLPKFLLCVNWGNPEHKFEAYRLLNMWKPPTSLASALELLDFKYPDYTVRKYAINCLKALKDDELRLYLLQLTQCLKYEPYHDNPLKRFLVERSLRNPFEVGHHFFWHLKAEIHEPMVTERFSLILEEYLANCGRYSSALRNQHLAVIKLQRVASMVVDRKRAGFSDAECMKEYIKELEKLNRDFFEPLGQFQIPIDPKLVATTLLIQKCAYMSSKMVPLWLVFNNADEDAPPIYIMYKSGDDLRQDILTLQILTVMDKIWLADGLDLRLKPYRCLATGVNENGDGVGMIEVVMNSDTTSGIQLKYGGGAMGALKMDPIDLFLHDHNKGKALYDRAVDNFIRSCAGYCVATFVLGIGDRHNGNIMVTKDGHLFHIDFGHFLGNFKKKFGVNRERAAFVFTPEMAYVMGGKKYKKSTQFKQFLTLSTKAFFSLRQNAVIVENLFILMVTAGMPELMMEEDIYYLREKLYLNMTEKKAEKRLMEEINKSLDSTFRRIDNMIHNLVHG